MGDFVRNFCGSVIVIVGLSCTFAVVVGVVIAVVVVVAVAVAATSFGCAFVRSWKSKNEMEMLLLY